MFPMDFEEFLWAIGDEVSAETIRYLIKNKKAAGNAKMHRNLDADIQIVYACWWNATVHRNVYREKQFAIG